MPVSRWKPEHLGLFYGLLGSMLFACKGILIKLAYHHGVSTETFLGLRMMWAADRKSTRLNQTDRRAHV